MAVSSMRYTVATHEGNVVRRRHYSKRRDAAARAFARECHRAIVETPAGTQSMLSFASTADKLQASIADGKRQRAEFEYGDRRINLYSRREVSK